MVCYVLGHLIHCSVAQRASQPRPYARGERGSAYRCRYNNSHREVRAPNDAHRIELRIPPEDDELDDPSGAAATAVAMYSLATQRCVRMDTIMSASLVIENGVTTGALESIGGVVEKVLAATDFGLRRMILAPENAEAEDIDKAGLTAEEHPRWKSFTAQMCWRFWTTFFE
uniref:Lon proteolytic domain-containing protein n=1 Tax=Globodera pallida TaxID=36090 RepID=A0A183CF06_GLOPA